MLLLFLFAFGAAKFDQSRAAAKAKKEAEEAKAKEIADLEAREAEFAGDEKSGLLGGGRSRYE